MDEAAFASVHLSPRLVVRCVAARSRNPTPLAFLSFAHASDLIVETEPRPPPEHDTGEATAIPSPPRGHEAMRKYTRSTPVHSPCQTVAILALRRGAAVLWVAVVMSPAGPFCLALTPCLIPP